MRQPWGFDGIFKILSHVHSPCWLIISSGVTLSNIHWGWSSFPTNQWNGSIMEWRGGWTTFNWSKGWSYSRWIERTLRLKVRHLMVFEGKNEQNPMGFWTFSLETTHWLDDFSSSSSSFSSSTSSSSSTSRLGLRRQPQAPDLSGHCGTSIASARCQIECQKRC
jgi:hypothetical protein